MSLCDNCKARRENLTGSIIASGGWCAPSGTIYGLDEPSCYVIKSIPFEDFIFAAKGTKKITRKQAIKAFRRWKRNEDMVGQVVHGLFMGTFPEIPVLRGGIKFNYQRESNP